jgi:hypothetical protein
LAEKKAKEAAEAQAKLDAAKKEQERLQKLEEEAKAE